MGMYDEIKVTHPKVDPQATYQTKSFFSAGDIYFFSEEGLFLTGSMFDGVEENYSEKEKIYHTGLVEMYTIREHTTPSVATYFMLFDRGDLLWIMTEKEFEKSLELKKT